MQHDWAGGPVARDYGEELGTPFKVFLAEGVEHEFNPITRKTMTHIIDLPGLIGSILQSRVLHPRKLSGDDLKYIRSALKMRSTDVADVLEFSPEHYSRCEAGTKTLSTSAEKFYRMYVFLKAASKDKVIIEQISKKECNYEQAKEAFEAFKSVFLEMKIQHIFSAGNGLEFSFNWESRRRKKKPIADCGRENGKWRKETEKQVAA